MLDLEDVSYCVYFHSSKRQNDREERFLTLGQAEAGDRNPAELCVPLPAASQDLHWQEAGLGL